MADLFDLLFAPARPAQQVAPAPTADHRLRLPAGPALDPEAPRRQRPKIRYAALPKSEPLQIKVTDRQTPLDMKAGPAAAFMKDETLRPGDIVVMKDGPKVFVGRPDDRHTARDFESIGRSDFIDRRTRNQLAAMMLPIGAMPADQARKMMAAGAQGDARQRRPVRRGRRLTAMRVINPWKTNPLVGRSGGPDRDQEAVDLPAQGRQPDGRGRSRQRAPGPSRFGRIPPPRGRRRCGRTPRGCLPRSARCCGRSPASRLPVGRRPPRCPPRCGSGAG